MLLRSPTGRARKTSWHQTLQEKKLIWHKSEEMDWSSSGQHIEITQTQKPIIDKLLLPQGVLGHSSTALVERVLCRRIMLARKTIRCNLRLNCEDAVEEVAHPQRLVTRTSSAVWEPTSLERNY
jgi:hypothetical protein